MGILSGIPCAEAVEKKISDYAVSAIIRGLKYMFRYKSLVKDLDSEIEKLINEKEKISRRVQEENDNGKIINKDVLTWQTKVEEIQKKDKELSPSFRCIQCLPIPNPVSRLRLGRKAVKKSEIVIALTASGKELSDKDKDIAYIPGRSKDVSRTNAVFPDFPSRQEAYGKLWTQLVSEDSLILGIYGMPGVGKTRMMEQIWQEARGKKIFNKVTLAVVGSVTFDVIKLQDQIASNLNCNLESKDDKVKRADQLKRSMMNSGKILAIFDDVWGEISLYDIIGTSFDDGNSWKGCKILFTSREKPNCLINKCGNPVEIKTLEEKEALDMFENTPGTEQFDYLQDDSLVKKVCKKCAGVPLVIYAVGKALKFKTHILWEDALKKLEDCEIENIFGIDPKLHACLKLSFDNLQEDTRQCLFLCSLCPPDGVINMETLFLIATGSQLVKGRSARIRLGAMVDTLKSSSLLLTAGEDDQTIKLHDITRDVARSIAQKDYAYLIKECGLGLPGACADYAARKVVLLELRKDNFSFPPDLVCPDLHFLLLQRSYVEWPLKVRVPKFSVGMFENLSFLVLAAFYSEQELSLQPLNKLKMLFIVESDIRATDVSCFPQSLETLCIGNCHLPTPLNFSKLINLRKIEIYGSTPLHIVPNTMSSLSYLEELHLATEKTSLGEMLLPKFHEISNLTCLTSLEIFWSDFEPFQDTSIFRELIKYNIFVGVYEPLAYARRPIYASSTRVIELACKVQFESFQDLVERAEVVILRGIDVNIKSFLNRNTAFKDLRNLHIEYCDNMEYLARLHNEIQYSLPQQTSFSKLTSLGIGNCPAMKYLFNNSAAKCLVQLQELRISICNVMEVIIIDESQGDEDIISFSKLKLLELSHLPRLKSFYGEILDLQLSSPLIIDNSVIPSVRSQPLFDERVAFPSLEVLEISGLHNTVTDIWAKSYYNNDNVSSSFWKLKTLKVSDCSGLKNVFQQSSMASNLFRLLKNLCGGSCVMMREIIGEGELEEITFINTIVFPELTNLDLYNLPSLIGVCSYTRGQANTKIKFPALVTFTLEDLETNLEVIELGSNDYNSRLEYLNISCNKETQLPSAWKPQIYDLESLTLRHCLSDVLKSLCIFQRLKFLKVTELECCTLFSLSVLISLQQLHVLDISNCSILEEIVDDARGDGVPDMDKETITLFNLQTVVLHDLPKLTSFIHGANYELHMPALERVEVANCGLSTLFTCSVFQKLQLLKDLSVLNCKSLEGIVAQSMGIETSDTYDNIITASQLYAVNLSNLPNFKSFSLTVTYAFNMPKLHWFNLHKCPRIENFTSLRTSTGLVKVYSEWHGEEEVSNLDDYTREYRKRCEGANQEPLEVSFFSFPWSCPWAY